MSDSVGPHRIGLVSAWASRLGGGVFEAVLEHCAIVRAAGYEPVVFALADEHSAEDLWRFGEVAVHCVPVAGPDLFGYAPRLVPEMRAAGLDLIHLHGIWKYPSAAASAFAAEAGLPYVISPHGMLDPWILSRGRLKKAMARIGYERRSWRRASCFHALTAQEASCIRVEQPRAATAVIPNAVRPPDDIDAQRTRTIVYLGRIHEKKNVLALVDGFAAARAAAGGDASLVIAGWGDAEVVAALRRRLAAPWAHGISFVGPVYGAEKAKLIGTACFLALPSHSEGLPMVILESWAAGTPTAMSAQCNLPEGFVNGAALDCGTSVESIGAALTRALTIGQAEWEAMSFAARSLASRSFAPNIVVAEWRALYAQLLAPSAPTAA